MFLTTQSVNRLFLFSDLIPQTTQKCCGILVKTMSTRSSVAVAAHTCFASGFFSTFSSLGRDAAATRFALRLLSDQLNDASRKEKKRSHRKDGHIMTQFVSESLSVTL